MCSYQYYNRQAYLGQVNVWPFRQRNAKGDILESLCLEIDVSVHIAPKFMYGLLHMSATIYEVRTCIAQYINNLHKYALGSTIIGSNQIGCCKNVIILLESLCIKKYIVHQIHVCHVMR